MKSIVFLMLLLFSVSASATTTEKLKLAASIQQNRDFSVVKDKAFEIIRSGFNAGDGYREVWIRDLNTFVELAVDSGVNDELREALLLFFRLQGEDGNIVDGYTRRGILTLFRSKADCMRTELTPDYCGHKNTVETDQETSLIQAVYKYVKRTGDNDFLTTSVGGQSVMTRMDGAMLYLLENRWSDKHGLLIGATTADWGDVQHTHYKGVDISDDTKFCVDIYDNAMFLIALDNMMELVPSTEAKWRAIYDSVAENAMTHLWDSDRHKFIPHVYIDGSPYPDDFDENAIFYHGGTAVAIEAGLLNKEQVKTSLDRMVANVEASGAASIGLTLYPVYPDWAFKNRQMRPWSYQNGGDWSWFGGRMIQQLINYGFVEDAYEQLLPMTARVVSNEGFYEWYTRENKPRGSGTFRGSAGVLYKAIVMLEEWAEQQSQGIKSDSLNLQ